MSTPKKNVGHPKPGARPSIFAHLTAVASATAVKLSKSKTIIALILFPFVILALICCCHAGELSLSMLYLLANNGKLSGRADGNVYMRNGRVRGYVVPSLVQNAYTQLQRTQLALLSSAYRALSPTEQESWINLSGLFRSNRWGNPIEIKGKAAYVLLNMNLFNIGVNPLPTAPLLLSVPSITALAVASDKSDSTVDITFAPDPTDIDVLHLVYATACMSPGVYRPSSSRYRLIGVILGGATGPELMGSNWLTKFGALTVGMKIFVKVIGINSGTGQASPAAIGSTIVVA